MSSPSRHWRKSAVAIAVGALLWLGVTTPATPQVPPAASEAGNQPHDADDDDDDDVEAEEELESAESWERNRGELRRLNEQVDVLINQVVRPRTPEARQIADSLVTRARIHLMMNDRQAARHDLEQGLRLVPAHPGALGLLAEMRSEENQSASETEWPVEWPPHPEFEVPAAKPSRSLQVPLFALVADIPWYFALPAAWFILWFLFLGQGTRTTREVHGSRLRLGWVAALLAAVCLLPLIGSTLWGLLHDPTPEQLIVLSMGTFMSVVFCLQFLQPPIQIQGQQSLPLVENPEFLDRVARLSEVIGVVPPRVRLWPSTTDSQQALAFAGCLSAPQLVVTDGILNRLSTAESDAILAHELGHIANHTLWFFAPLMSLAATAACLVSESGIWVALGLGMLVFVGLRRISSRPLEFDCDRRAAQAVSPQAMIIALEKIHVLHPLQGENWLSELCFATSTHPSLNSRTACLKRFANNPLSDGECQALIRSQRLGWLAVGAWICAIVGGLFVLYRWPEMTHAVSMIWIGLALVPLLLLLQGTRKVRQMHARRLVTTGSSRGKWIFGALIALCAVGIFLPLEYFADWPFSPLVSVTSICLMVITVGIALMRLTRRSRLQHNILTDFTLGKYENVVQTFDSAPRWFQRNPAYENTTAIALALTDRRAEALHRLEQLELREPQFPAGLMTLIALDYDDGKDARAEGLAARLTELLPDDPVGPFRQVLSLVRMGQLDRARDVVTAARSRIPTAPLLNLAEAAVAIADNQQEKARELLELSERQLPGDCHLAVLWVEYFLRQGNIPDALGALERLDSMARSNRLAFLDGTLFRLRQQLSGQHRTLSLEELPESPSPAPPSG